MQHTWYAMRMACQSSFLLQTPSSLSFTFLPSARAFWTFLALSSVSWSPPKQTKSAGVFWPFTCDIGTYLLWRCSKMSTISSLRVSFFGRQPRGIYKKQRLSTDQRNNLSNHSLGTQFIPYRMFSLFTLLAIFQGVAVLTVGGSS